MPRVGLESLSITDAAGQTTTYTYNARHQPLTITNAKNETTTYAYDATSGRLTSITGPVSGAMTAYTYDAYGRVRTTTDSDGYTVTLDYDTFDRPTRTTYQDSTYEETTYRYLDPVTRRDRLGRVTRFAYDAARRLTATTDPLGRTVTQGVVPKISGCRRPERPPETREGAMPAVQMVVLVFLLLSAGCRTIGGAQSLELRHAEVRALFEAAFPELLKEHEPLVVGRGSMFNVRIGSVEGARINAFVTVADHNPAYVSVAYITGSYVHTDTLVNMDFITQGDASLVTVKAELAALGAKFGPDKAEDLISAAQLNRYIAVLGRIDAAKAEFVWADAPDVLGRRNVTIPTWKLTPKNVRHGRAMCSIVQLEPIDGRLQALQQQPCAP